MPSKAQPQAHEIIDQYFKTRNGLDQARRRAQYERLERAQAANNRLGALVQQLKAQHR